MIGRLVLREIAARRGRFAWLAIAVTVAVAFTVGATGFAARLTSNLTTAGEASRQAELLPQGSVVVTATTASITTATALSDQLIATIRATPGVATAEGSYDQPVAFRLPPGTQRERPVMLRGVVLSSTLDERRWTVAAGRAPIGPDEIAVDLGGAAVGRAELGATVVVELPTGARDVDVVGVVAPAAGSPARVDPSLAVALSSAHMVFDPAVAPLLLDAVGRVDRVTVLPMPGVTPDVLAARLRGVVGDGIRVEATTTRLAATQHTVAAIDDGVQRGVDAFAALSILISALVVANTLGVIVAQRSRELALLRLIGASKRQLARLVVGEAVVVGVVGAVAGLGVGIVLAWVAARVVDETSAPGGPLLVPSMVAVAFGVGLGVMLLGSLAPARLAGRVSPMQAWSAGDARPPQARTFRTVAVLVVVSVIAVAWSATRPGGPVGGEVAVGAAGIIAGLIGLAVATRWVVRPIVRMVGPLLRRVGGRPTRLAVANAERSPRRTAASSSSLIVALALVGVVATVGASVRSAVLSQFSSSSRADLYVERRGVVRVSTPAITERLARVAGPSRAGIIAEVDLSSVDGSMTGPRGSTTTLAMARLDELSRLVDLGIEHGSIPTLAELVRTLPQHSELTPQVIVSSSLASRLGVRVGDDVQLRPTAGARRTGVIVATYTNTAIAGDAVVEQWTGADPAWGGSFELALIRARGPNATVDLTRAAGHFPNVRVHTPEEFGQLNATVTDTVLRVLGVVLVGMVGIGYLGLVATLGLATRERHRELVMMRAIGGLRRQVRAMVVAEAALIGFIAAAVGLAAGTGVGWLVASALPDALARDVVVPVRLLAGLGVGAVVTACVVSVGVARRAGRVPPADAGRVE